MSSDHFAEVHKWPGQCNNEILFRGKVIVVLLPILWRIPCLNSSINLVWNLGVVDLGRQNFNFSRQISKKFSFFQSVSQKIFRFFQANFWKISIFSGKFLKNRFFQAILKKIWFSTQKLLLCSYFWANYSISLQKSPLLNILPVHDKI